MKQTILCLSLCAFLFSCQEETSFEGSENMKWQKKKSGGRSNAFSGDGGNNTATVQSVPFDFGLSAVLGVGALAAVRSARKRK